MELTNTQSSGIIKSLPHFPLSYEIVSHKKVVSTPGISTAIATGKKYLAWFTFKHTENVCYLIELNKNRVPIKVFLAKTNYDWSLCTGTIVYGTIPDVDSGAGTGAGTTVSSSSLSGLTAKATPFLVENIYLFKGVPLANFQNGNYCFGSKLEFIADFMKCVSETPLQNGRDNRHTPQLVFHLPAMWYIDETNKDQCASIPEPIAASISYTCHHVQYKELNKVSTFFNFNITKMKEATLLNDDQLQIKTILASMHTPCVPDLTKPQYKLPTTFRVVADIQYDIYHLYAGKGAHNSSYEYYGVACIPSYEKSVMMNRFFRNIRENENIDYIEESDTEEDFENLDSTRYVDLDKEMFIECVFHEKFRKWEPRVESTREKLVCIDKLNQSVVRYSGQRPQYHQRSQSQHSYRPAQSLRDAGGASRPLSRDAGGASRPLPNTFIKKNPRKEYRQDYRKIHNETRHEN